MLGVKCFILAACLLPAMAVESMDKFYAMSVANMEELLDHDEQLLNILEDYANVLQERVNDIDAYVREASSRHALAKEEGYDAYLSNPLNSFALMRHMRFDWYSWLSYLEQKPGAAHSANITAMRSLLPTEQDMNQASIGLRRIQNIYGLKAADIALGKLQNVQYNSSFTALECYVMAKYCLSQYYDKYAADWLSIGIQIMDSSNGSELELLGLHGSKLYELLIEVLEELDRFDEAMLVLKSALSQWPTNENFQLLYYKLRAELLLVKTEAENDGLQQLYKPCCVNECRPKTRLQCFYNTNGTPLMRLAPVKTELLSRQPYIVLYHDILNEKQMTYLREQAKPNLRPTVTNESHNSKAIVSSMRTSKGSWLEDTYSAEMAYIQQQLSDMTDMHIEHSEPFQIMNYGIGGTFISHLDYFNTSEGIWGDRIASAVYYLSKVQQGGATAFDLLDLSVFPKPGAILFWHNIDIKTGKGDPKTKHSACPTIVGSRWAMTKWIGEKDQIFRHKCRPDGHTE